MLTPLILTNPTTTPITDEQFYQLSLVNRDVKLERTAQGDLWIMPPMGGITGKRNSHLNLELGLWNRGSQLGVVLDSSTGFHLPNGAYFSPNAAWVALAQWESLTLERKEKFLPLAPDFVVELRSKSDRLPRLQAKMQEYIDNGTRLAWLLNPQNRAVEIYRPGQPPKLLVNPAQLLGEDVLLGFVLNLALIW